MTVQDLMPYISLLIAAATIYFARRKENKEDASVITKVGVQVDAIANDVSDVKADVKALRSETREDHDKIVLLQSKVDALGIRVDELKEVIR